MPEPAAHPVEPSPLPPPSPGGARTTPGTPAAQSGQDSAATPEDEHRDAVLQWRRHPAHLSPILEREPIWARDFTDLSYEWRRLFSELYGTFLLVLVGAGGGVLAATTHGAIGREARVTAPGLMVASIILFMGAVSGAHLNPVVSIAFALRGDFRWRRVPGYLLAQCAGGTLAAAVLRAMFGTAAHLGATMPGPGFSVTQAFTIEALLTLGLVSTILGASSSAQNIGPLAAIAVGSYIVLAGLWASPVSGASMNPARSLGPALVGADLHDLWVYLLAPLVGALAAVAAAWVLRGPGGGPAGTKAAQGTLRPGSPAAGPTV